MAFAAGFKADPGQALQIYYLRLLQELGPQGWWPARTRLQVILGAILTQNTSWHNAVLALKQLRRADVLSLSRLRQIKQNQLQSLIRPAGFFRQKARTIRAFVSWLGVVEGGSLRSLFARQPDGLRSELLKIKGLGPETVDAILLYAGGWPFFVADAYTRRILGRHGLVPAGADYDAAQRFLHQYLPADPKLFNEYHALLVEVGKRYCKSSAAHCEACPLQEFLPHVPARRRSRSHEEVDFYGQQHVNK